MIIRCPHDQLVQIGELKANPKNRNSHPQDQLERLAKILAYQGWRYPVKVSKRSGFVTSGHGRIEAARLNGWTQVPVSFQDYESDEQEYADLTADNAIASWSELDLADVNADLPDFGPELDIEMLGIKDFTVEAAAGEFPDLESGDPDFTQRTFILSTEQSDILDRALERAKLHEDCTDEINENAPANALAAILRKYVCS